MSNTDDARERIERLIAAADRVAQQPLPPPQPRRWVPVAAVAFAGTAAVLLGVNLVSGGDRTILVPQTTAVPTVPPGPSTPTSLPVVITIPPTSTIVFPTSTAPVVPPSTTSATTATTNATTPSSTGSTTPVEEVVRWATYTGSGFVLQGHVPDQSSSAALAMKFSAAAGSANVRNELVIRAGTSRPTSEPLYAHDALQFPASSAALQPPAIAFLDVFATFLLQNPNITVDIDAHTEDVGPAADNLALSQARADAVADRLVAMGVARERLTATGHGASLPVADNATEAGRGANRRVEFLLHDVLAGR